MFLFPAVFDRFRIHYHAPVRKQMIFAAIRALVLPFFLRPFCVLDFNAGFAGIRRRGKQPHSPVPERRHTFCG